MKLASCGIFLCLIGFTYSIGWHIPSHVFDSNAERDPHGKGKAFVDNMNRLWDQHTSEEDPSITNFQLTYDETVYNITGKVMRTNLVDDELKEQRRIFAYQGFRYGKEPDNTSKFKPPIPVDNPFTDGSDTDIAANHLGDKCPQNSMIGSTIAGKLDCLFLNVYTPYNPTDIIMNETKLPVMFFIHGGAFVMGDASMYLPTKLLAHDVILVTIHYRMGAQGFFTLNNAEAPGNTALYDMIEALKWTNDYIEYFGGDINSITIFGESAGSVSVNFLMISPLAAGLFKGVIAESGSSLDNWATDEDPSYAANFIANDLECDMTDDSTIFQCMLDATDEQLVIAENHLIGHDRHSGYTGFRGAAPTIQLNYTYTGVEPVITMNPTKYLYSGNFNQVPFMTGANRQEGSFVVGIMFSDYLLYNNLQNNTDWKREQMVQQLLLSAGIVDDTHVLDTVLTNYFCAGIDMANLTAAVPCLIDIAGAIFLKGGSWQTCNIHSKMVPDSERFYYSFEFESDDTMYAWLLGPEDWDTGITHSDEMMYIFSMPATMEGMQIDTEKRMTLMWTNFAKYGNPTPDEDKSWMDLDIPKWESYKFEDPKFMIIKNEWEVDDEFSDRWTISYDEATKPGLFTTLLPPGVTSDEPPVVGTTDESQKKIYTQQDYDDLHNKSVAYMATMIVFIILFVAADIFGIYFFMQYRKLK